MWTLQHVLVITNAISIFHWQKLADVLFWGIFFLYVFRNESKTQTQRSNQTLFSSSFNNDHIPLLVADDSVVSLVSLPFERPSHNESVLLADCTMGNAQQTEMFFKKIRLNDLMMQFGYQAHALCLGFVFGATVEDRFCMVVPK